MTIPLTYRKKRIRSLFFIYTIFLMMLGSLDTNAKNSVLPKTKTESIQNDQALADQCLVRLDEIKAMDHSKMSPPQRKTIVKELMDMKKRLQSLDGGVYISTGAIIIILLLIIILF